MRKLPILLLWLAIAYPALAAERVTVQQVDQLLSAHPKSDATLASRIEFLELTERAGPSTLARWMQASPGPRTHDALLALSDASAFLHLPVSEIPSSPPPSLREQGEILSRAIDYVSRTIIRLPNFFAIRETIRYEDAPSEQIVPVQPLAGVPQLSRSLGSTRILTSSEAQPLHIINRSATRVTYRDGREVVDKQTVSAQDAESTGLNLTTAGEFGPILSLVLADAVRSSMSWSHWEHGDSGLQAVLRYSVPETNSHYLVAFPYRDQQQRQYPAYHGEIAIDPATGAILRLTVISDLKPPFERVSAAIAVQYAPVEIGSRSYICPIKAVALSRMPVAGADSSVPIASAGTRTQLNDVTFTQFHVFRAHSQIVARANLPPAGTPTPPAPPPAEAPAPASTPAESALIPAVTTSPALQASAPSPAVETADTPSIAAAPKAAPSEPDDIPNPPVLQAYTKTVLVDITVTVRNRPVHGLTRAQFHVFEDDTPRAISSFDEHQIDDQTAATTNPAGTTDILLLDDLNTPLADQLQVRRQLLEYLRKAHPTTPLALMSLSATQLRVLHAPTTDTEALIRTLQSREAEPHTSALDQPTEDASVQNLGAMAKNSSPAAAELAAHIQALQNNAGYQSAAERARATLIALQQLAHGLTAVSGRKNLIWFSLFLPVTLDPPTSNALASARVAVYPVDVRGLCAASAVVTGCGDNLPTHASYIAMEQQLAQQTGGHAYAETNGFADAVREVATNDSSYYTLTYPPLTGTTAGPFRRIEIRLDPAGYTLSYRRGYFATTP
jgi:VWFA-related protein